MPILTGQVSVGNWIHDCQHEVKDIQSKDSNNLHTQKK